MIEPGFETILFCLHLLPFSTPILRFGKYFFFMRQLVQIFVQEYRGIVKMKATTFIKKYRQHLIIFIILLIILLLQLTASGQKQGNDADPEYTSYMTVLKQERDNQ